MFLARKQSIEQRTEREKSTSRNPVRLVSNLLCLMI